MHTQKICSYTDEVWGATDLTDFSLEALDGSIGKIDEASNEVGAGYIVVDTGPWILGPGGAGYNAGTREHSGPAGSGRADRL